MRVLVVLAFKGPSARQHGERFVRHVKAAFSDSGLQESVEVIVRTQAELRDFLPPLPPAGAAPDVRLVQHNISAFDGLDFVFIDGDDNLLPWMPAAAELLQLVHLAVVSGKCILGCGCALQLLTYLVAVGPVQVPVFNGDGKGGTLDTFLQGPEVADSATDGEGVLLERTTGDMFRYEGTVRAWTPVGNVGLHCSIGAPPAEEQRRTMPVPTEVNRSNGIAVCRVAQLMRTHPLFADVWPARFEVPQRNDWHCHLRPTESIGVPTGTFAVKSLASSAMGVQVLECRNVVMLQFRPDDRCAATVQLMRNFVNDKLALISRERMGGGVADVPRRMDEMAARDPIYSDLMQQVVMSLSSEPRLSLAPVASAPGPLGVRSSARSASRPTSARSAASAPLARTVVVSGSAPAWGQVGERMGERMGGARPESARSVASTTCTRASASSSMGTAPMSVASGVVGRGGRQGAYVPDAKSALAYLHSSKLAIERAERPEMARQMTAVAEMPGVANSMPLFATKPKATPVPRVAVLEPPPASASAPGTPASARGMARGHSASAIKPTLGGALGQKLGGQAASEDGASGPSSPSEVPRPASSPKLRTPSESESAWGGSGGLPSAEAVFAMLATKPAPKPPKPPVKRYNHAAQKPFCNWHKHEAAKRALKNSSQFVTSIGPYVGVVEQYNMDATGQREKSIHKAAFKPGGLWDKHDKSHAGFAAGGFNLPSDLPMSAYRHGSFYNANMHNFRMTKPKKNLYM